MKAIKPRNWNPVVGSLLCYLQKSGFTLVSVAGVDVTGTERTQRQQAKARLIKRTFGVVIVDTPEGIRNYLRVHLEGDPEDIVTDSSCNPHLEELIEIFSNKWSKRNSK